MIRVVFRSGEEDLVSPKFLDILLFLDQVQMFERAGGWVVIGVDRLRSPQSPTQYPADRRHHKPTPLPPQTCRNIWVEHPAHQP
jgi:hypothetical protein